jgi:hypothetical protein
MSRQDYIKIARALGAANATVNDQGWDDRIHAEIMAAMLALDNPRFDRERFLAEVTMTQQEMSLS